VDTSQASTRGTISYILIGDIGQTIEEELYSGLINAAFILDKTISLPGSNPLRVGHVDAVRLVYSRNNILGEKEVLIKKTVVQQANITIDAFDTVFSGAVLSMDSYITVYPIY